MINVKDLTEKQREALRVMSEFVCTNISCEDCPLLNEFGCGSVAVEHILERYEEETRQ